MMSFAGGQKAITKSQAEKAQMSLTEELARNSFWGKWGLMGLTFTPLLLSQ